MSSRWNESFHHAFAWRLGLWYAALFVASTATLAVVTYVLLKLVGAFAPLRVSTQQELEGLDISQHGEALQ